MKTSIQEQMRIITKGAHQVVNEADLEAKLKKSMMTNTPLKIKLGLDPSAPDIHLGHAVVLRKIRQMQDLGHEALIIIGDFTGQIGDPTGKAKGRTALTTEQVQKNALTYTDQMMKILDESKTTVLFNGDWLRELKFEEVIRLAATTTVARMLERDDFQTRYRNNTPIGVHEFFYPLMQAYDSIQTHADIELGGTDQTFNILMGRNLQKALGQEPQIALFMPLLEGLDGKEKMSKSLGNYIGIYEDARVMFKKVMEVPDELIIKYYELTTDEHPDKIERIQQELDEGKNPKDLKYDLACVITSLYHNPAEVQGAREYYDEAFTRKSIPADIPELVLDGDADLLIDIIPLLVKQGYVSSNGEFRRLAAQNGVQINQEKVLDLEQVLYCGDIIKIGKKRFLKIVK